MKSLTIKLLALAAAVGAVTALSACRDDHQPAAASPSSNSENFSAFAKQTYAFGENTTPVNFDAVTLVYDVDNDPTAFDSLLM